ncbi:hypothetical protein Fot_14130 [Forsythia ovata]|uniref:Uncharacterized protein n=1 Tax=Forsythia ovata TaxID=205694 RepID=A0ABD1W5Q5_9LAMI
MAVISPSRRCKECSPVTSIIGTNIQLKYLVKDRTKNLCLNDQVCPNKCHSRALDLWGVLNAMEELGPSSLSKKFSNGTFTMDIDVDDRHFQDSDLDDQAESYLLKVSTSFF